MSYLKKLRKEKIFGYAKYASCTHGKKAKAFPCASCISHKRKVF